VRLPEACGADTSGTAGNVQWMRIGLGRRSSIAVRLLGVVALICATADASAPSANAAATTLTFTVQKDATVKARQPTTSFGQATDLQVSAQAGYEKVTYVQVAVSGIPSGSMVTSATLRLRSKTTSTNRPVTVYAVASTQWPEDATTWAERPALRSPLASVTNLTSGSLAAWSLTDHVIGNGTYALALAGAQPGDLTFSSAESSTPPTLEVTHAPRPTYTARLGNTHAHTTYTSSHGSVPPDNGPPREHHARAKAAGFAFYATTDHSQEVAFDPTSETNPAWVDTKEAASTASDATYLGLAGFELSENNADKADAHPGQGHINVLDSAAYLDAMEPGVDLPALYDWLGRAAPATPGLPVVATFNHPQPGDFHGFDYRTPAATDVMALLEVYNVGAGVFEDAYRAANNAGWHVSPTCGIDNHGFWAITHKPPCAGVLSADLSKQAVLEAMRARRTFATSEDHLVLSVTGNGFPMGTTLHFPASIALVVKAGDADTADARDQITRLEVVDGTGAVVASTVTTGHDVTWSTTIAVEGRRWVYVRASNAGSPDAPVAWSAPIWTGY
jgi:hypothetical protein